MRKSRVFVLELWKQSSLEDKDYRDQGSTNIEKTIFGHGKK